MTPRSPHDTGPDDVGARTRDLEGPRVVLASASPRRRELLEMLRLSIDIRPAHVDESARDGEAPEALAERLARDKATAVARDAADALVIGSDTIVVVDDEVLGKPTGETDAVAMLLRLSGRSHRVLTGIAVVAPDGRVESSTVDVEVVFRAFDEDLAAAYVATGEPLDKAGAYGIQGLGSALVERIDGDFFAVMGLPIHRLLAHLEALGWCYRFHGLSPCEPS